MGTNSRVSFSRLIVWTHCSRRLGRCGSDHVMAAGPKRAWFRSFACRFVMASDYISPPHASDSRPIWHNCILQTFVHGLSLLVAAGYAADGSRPSLSTQLSPETRASFRPPDANLRSPHPDAEATTRGPSRPCSAHKNPPASPSTTPPTAPPTTLDAINPTNSQPAGRDPRGLPQPPPL